MRCLKQERGAVTIIEASFVFPIALFIVFIMIMTGECYYQFSRAERAVTAAAVDGAARCENPLLGTAIKKNAVETDPRKEDILPYRYIFTSKANEIGKQVQQELTKEIKDYQPLLFRNMSPQHVSVKVNVRMNVLVSSFPVECSFDIPFPIRLIFYDHPLKFSYSIRTSAPISDPAEFVRNVAMIKDLAERSEKVMELAGKVKNAMTKIGQYTN